MTDIPGIPAVADREHLSCDVAIVGGGTAGTMAAITAAEHGASVLLLEKAHVPPLASALRDPHADVRKAAVIALAPMSGHPAAAAALRAAVDDSDADVRAYARRASTLSSSQT